VGCSIKQNEFVNLLLVCSVVDTGRTTFLEENRRRKLTIFNGMTSVFFFVGCNLTVDDVVSLKLFHCYRPISSCFMGGK